MPRQATTYPHSPSTLPPSHILVHLGVPRGSGNFLCTDINKVERLVEMPNKVRRVSYAARGMFAIVSLWDKTDTQSSLVGEIVHVVTGPELKSWRRAGKWPKEFEHPVAGDMKDPTRPDGADGEGDGDGDGEGEGEGERESGDELDDLPENPNRRRTVVVSSDEDESEDDDEEDDEDEDDKA